MADPVIPVHRLSCGDEYFDLSDLWSDEMAQVKSWTGLKNKAEFHAALKEEDPDAVAAAFTIARRRGGDKGCRFSAVRVNLDLLKWSRHLDGRTVEVDYDKNDDGSAVEVVFDPAKQMPVLEGGEFVLPTGDEDEVVGPAVHYDESGNLLWRYVDTGEQVRPTSQPAPSGTTGSPSTETTSGDGSDSGSGTPMTDDT